ncbi:MAG: hypothetical protein QNK37_17520 [Acidobacteriota bacterium]|nr:hypothetical protein [Acidobacteriota bacterium]
MSFQPGNLEFFSRKLFLYSELPGPSIEHANAIPSKWLHNMTPKPGKCGHFDPEMHKNSSDQPIRDSFFHERGKDTVKLKNLSSSESARCRPDFSFFHDRGKCRRIFPRSWKNLNPLERLHKDAGACIFLETGPPTPV